MKVKIVTVLIVVSFSNAFNLSFIKPTTKEVTEDSVMASKFITRDAISLSEILDKAVVSRKITSLDKYRLNAMYGKLKNGGVLLAQCLKTKGCNPYKFYKEVYNKPPLYQHIYLKYPSISTVALMQKVGAVNEKIMDKYFASTGWKKVEGEIGRNGVDGLYVKVDKNGNIKDVMLVEAKYNKSTINKTVDGSMQMSKEWSLKKIDELIKKYPNNPEYGIIKKRIETGNYRARLWRMSENEGKLKIELKKIIPDNKTIKIENLQGGEKMKINYKDNFVVDLNNPKSSFHEKVAKWYKEALDEI